MKKNAKRVAESPTRGPRRIGNTGWVEGTVQDFFGLTDEEAALVTTKAALAVCLEERRRDLGWSQAVLAERLGSGQSRIAKIEAAHSSVSIDLMIRALLATGANMAQIGTVIATGDPHAKPNVKSRRKKTPRRSRRRTTATR